MDVGGVGEHLHYFVEYILECLDALVGLHGEAHGFGEDVAVARHVDFGDDGHAALGSVGLDFTTLGLRIVLAGIARHIGIGGELRICVHLKAPGEFLGQVPMEHVDLEACQAVNLGLELFDGQERATHVVHEAAHLEGGPVCHGQGLNGGCAVIALGQLAERLCRACHAQRGQCLDGNAL